MGHRVGEGMQVCRKGHQGLLQIICCLVRVVPIMATESAAAALAAALAESLAAALAAIPRMGAPAAGVPCHVRQLVRHMQACLDHDVGDLAGVFGLVGSQERHGSSLKRGGRRRLCDQRQCREEGGVWNPKNGLNQFFV